MPAACPGGADAPSPSTHARCACVGQVAGPDSRSLGRNRNGAQLRPSRIPGRLRGGPLLSCPKLKRARPCRGPGRPHRHTAWLLLLFLDRLAAVSRNRQDKGQRASCGARGRVEKLPTGHWAQPGGPPSAAGRPDRPRKGEELSEARPASGVWKPGKSTLLPLRATPTCVYVTCV